MGQTAAFLCLFVVVLVLLVVSLGLCVSSWLCRVPWFVCCLFLAVFVSLWLLTGAFVSLSAMSAVSQLSTRDITETSVTLVWTPPAVQYETYYITLTSQVRSGQHDVRNDL